MDHSSKKAKAPPPNLPQGPELLRRGLLALITALIVARPLVLGEDPGLLSPESEPGGMVLTLLWFMAGLGWAVWQAWSQKGEWYGSLVEIGLFAVVVLMFTSAAGPASYKHPAWLIAWEWLALLIAFGLVRQLTVSPLEQQGLLAAILASGVSLSAYGVYQFYVEMPETRRTVLAVPETPTTLKSEYVNAVLISPHLPFPVNIAWLELDKCFEKPPLLPLQRHLAQRGIFLEADDPQMESWVKRIEMNHAFSRFAHPNSFAGYLALLLPAMVGCAYASWRNQNPGWQTGLIVGCALLMGFALWLTHSRGAILGLLVAGGGAVALYWRRFLAANKGWAAAGIVGLIVLAVGGYFALKGGEAAATFGKEPGAVQVRLDYWAATWKMIGEHFWLGVGPGNFSRYYPRYMRPTAFEHITDPHNFLLETWATAGVLAALALLVAVGAFFWQIGRTQEASPPAKAPKGSPTSRPPAEQPRLYWEFYLGGMFGQIMALLVWGPGKSPDEIIVTGATFAVLSVFWFGAYALLERVQWFGQGRAVVLATGVAALLFNLCVSGGISFPSVATLLWVMAALALNALPQSPLDVLKRYWSARILAVPLLAALCVIYLTSFLNPVTSAAGYARLAQRNALHLHQPVKEDESQERPDVILVKYVLPALLEAVRADPGKIDYHLQAAHWYGETWKLHPFDRRLSDPALAHLRAVHGSGAPRSETERLPPPDRRMKNPSLEPIVKQLSAQSTSRAEAPALDPEGKDGFLANYRLRMGFAEYYIPEMRPGPFQVGFLDQQKKQYESAAKMMREVVKRDPTEARLRYQLAEVLFLLEKTAEKLHLLALETAKEKDKEAQQIAAKPKDPTMEKAWQEALNLAKGLEALAKEAKHDRTEAGKEARGQAQKAADLDKEAVVRTRKLTDRQREQVRKWLEAPGPS